MNKLRLLNSCVFPRARIVLPRQMTKGNHCLWAWFTIGNQRYAYPYPYFAKHYCHAYLYQVCPRNITVKKTTRCFGPDYDLLPPYHRPVDISSAKTPLNLRATPRIIKTATQVAVSDNPDCCSSYSSCASSLWQWHQKVRCPHRLLLRLPSMMPKCTSTSACKTNCLLQKSGQFPDEPVRIKVSQIHYVTSQTY